MTHLRTWTCSEAAKDRRPRSRVDGTYARAACSRSLPLRSAATFTTRPPVLSMTEPFSLATQRQPLGTTRPDATPTPRAPPPRSRQRPARVTSTSDARQPSPTVHVRPPPPPSAVHQYLAARVAHQVCSESAPRKVHPLHMAGAGGQRCLPPPKLNASSSHPHQDCPTMLLPPAWFSRVPLWTAGEYFYFKCSTTFLTPSTHTTNYFQFYLGANA